MKTETVLVVDNDACITELLAAELLPVLGYDTLVAHDGQGAMDVIREHQPDLMLLDLQLPDGNGLDLLRRLAREGYNIPTIIATGHGSEQVAVDAFRLGVQDYLIKPLDTHQLSEAISRALTESRLIREKAELVSQLKQQVNWLMVLSKVGQSVTSILDLDQVLRRIVDAAVYLTRADEGFLALVVGQSDQLSLRAAKDINHNHSTLINLSIHDSTAGAAVRTGRPVRLQSATLGDSLKISTGYLVHSLLHVPIFLKEKTLGVLSVDNRISHQPFTDMDETLLTALADYAAVAIENARLFEQAQQELAERKRAEAQLETSLKEKTVLLQEIHHRVKNNLQVIISLLNLHSSHIKDSQLHSVLQESQGRIRTMALIHQKLYQSTNLAEINVGDYIRELAADLFRSYQAETRHITLRLYVDDFFLAMDPAITCGLILNELVTNALKHAFPDDQGGEIRIEFQAGPDGQLSLVVADNGVGFPTPVDFNLNASLGLQLVNALVTQLNGTIEIEPQNGAEIRITFRGNPAS